VEIKPKKTYLYPTDQEMLDELAEALGTSDAATIRIAIRHLHQLHKEDPFGAQRIAQELKKIRPKH
jgi:hypothetical protein